MADDQDFDLGEWQRQQAAQAVAASQGQPNAIPNEPLTGDRTVAQTFTARGLPAPDTVIAPTNAVGRLPTPQEQTNLGIGNFVNQFGDTVGPTQDVSGYHQPMPQGATGVQGIVSPQEQQFWQQNPAGAFLNPQGGLTGLGTGQQPTSSGRLVPPEVFGGTSTPNQPSTPDYGQAINDYYTQRRQEIQDAKAPLMVHLGMADPSTIGASETTLLSKQGGRRGQPSQFDQAMQQLNNLNSQEKQIIAEHQAAVTDNAKTEHENLVRQTHIDAANGISNLSKGLNYINQNYQKGTPQYQAAITEILQNPQIAQAVTTRGGQEILAPHLKAHEDTAAITQRLSDQGYIAQPSHVGPEGVSYSIRKTGDTGDLEKELKSSYGITKENLLNPVQTLTGKINDQGTFSNQFPASEHNMVQVATGKSGTGKSVVMPMDTYNRYATGFGGQPASTAPAATATPVTSVAPQPDHEVALGWARTHPDDPRAKIIFQRNNVTQ